MFHGEMTMTTLRGKAVGALVTLAFVSVLVLALGMFPDVMFQYRMEHGDGQIQQVVAGM